MLINIDKKWSGLSKDIIINKYADMSNAVWEIRKNYIYDLTHILSMENIDVVKPIQDEYSVLLQHLNINDEHYIDFENMLGKEVIRKRAKDIKGMLSSLFKNVDENYLDVIEKRYMLTENIPAGYCDGTKYEKPIYDHCSSITGRTKIISGKNFLVMKKEERHLLQSSFKQGKIIEIDIVSLEPRVLCKLARNENYSDIYQHVSDNVICKAVDRKSVKLGVISALYGAGAKNN